MFEGIKRKPKIPENTARGPQKNLKNYEFIAGIRDIGTSKPSKQALIRGGR